MDITKEFSIYADKVIVDLEISNVTVTGFDINQLVGEFNITEILDSFDTDEIQDYLTKRIKEDAE